MEDYKEKYEKEQILHSRDVRIIDCLARWISLKQKDISIMDFFIDRKCKKIAIYGAAKLGILAYEEIKSISGIEPVCLFDKNAKKIRLKLNSEIEIYEPAEYLNHVKEIDAVLVTPIFYFDQIEEELLRQNPDIPIINFERVISYGEQKNE